MANGAMTPLGLAPKKCSLKARLLGGDKLYGGFLLTQTPYFAEMMGLVGYDYVVVDLEHGPGETKAALDCLRALEAVGTPAIIRVGYNDQVLLKKALDLGPSGVMVPMVQNAERAAFAVSCCRYPPRGIRGANPSVRASKFGLDKSYVHNYEKDLLIICQIESAQAVDLIPEIAGVDGVDALMLGPTDLSASIGCFGNPTNPRVAMLLDKAEKAVLSSPRRVSLMGLARPELDPPPALYKRGYDVVCGTIDVALFTRAALADIKAHKPLPLPDLPLPLPLSPTTAPLLSKDAIITPETNGAYASLYNGKDSSSVQRQPSQTSKPISLSLSLPQFHCSPRRPLMVCMHVSRMVTSAHLRKSDHRHHSFQAGPKIATLRALIPRVNYPVHTHGYLLP